MKKLSLLGLFSILIPLIGFSQSQPNINHSLSLNINRTFEGSGDLNGFSLNANFIKPITKKIDWFVAAGGTMADGEYPLIYKSQDDKDVDGSVRYTTAGLQLTGGINLNIIRNAKSKLFVGTGPLIRYQTTSDAGANIYYSSGLPFPVVAFQHTDPARTFSVGGILNAGYNYVIKDGFFIGLVGAFQTDTNGDNIAQIGLNFGKDF